MDAPLGRIIRITVFGCLLLVGGKGFGQSVASLSLSPNSLTAGQSSTGTVTLTGAASAKGVTIDLSSSNKGLAKVPASITIVSGAKTGTFTLSTVSDGKNYSATIKAFVGKSAAQATLSVIQQTITGLTLSQNPVLAGNSSNGTVTLAAPAPTGGFIVKLATDKAGKVYVPDSITVEGGQTAGSFAITSTAESTDYSSQITAESTSGPGKTTKISDLLNVYGLSKTWPRSRGNTVNTGLGLASGATGTLAWKTTLGTLNAAHSASAAIGADGTIYQAASTDADGLATTYLFALDRSGNTKWKYLLPGEVAQSSPAVAPDGTIYIGTVGGSFTAITPEGTNKWGFSLGLGGNVNASPVIGADGTIYTAASNGVCYAISAAGKVKWKYAIKTTSAINFIGDPAIGTDGTIYFEAWNDYLYALNPNGSLKWKYNTGSQVFAPPVVGTDGTVYIGSPDYHLYALTPKGVLKWAFLAGGELTTPAIGPDGTLYTGCSDGALYAVTPAGALKWKSNSGASGTPIIASDGTIYAASGDGMIFAVHPNGSLAWSFATAGLFSTELSAIGADGTLYIMDNACVLYSIK